MKFFFIDAFKGLYHLVDIKPKLEEYYRLLNCECIDIVQVQVSGHIYDVICDEEALLKENPIPSVLIDNHNFVYGNALICTDDGEGSETGISFSDTINIYAAIHNEFFKDFKFHPVLLGDFFEVDEI